jgi:hypothetical protein
VYVVVAWRRASEPARTSGRRAIATTIERTCSMPPGPEALFAPGLREAAAAAGLRR